MITQEQSNTKSDIEPNITKQELAIMESQAISAPTSQNGVNHFFLNVFIPGLGSLAHGKKTIGMIQLLTLLGGFISCGFLGWSGLGIVLISYVWSIITGFSFLKEKGDSLVWK